jgi:Predicted acetyltransferases and hydrolases with the alpha/beta hydrolase fold
MATFILVHGTFAKSAHWPALESGLVETARAAGENARFEQATWTGRNKIIARGVAATNIFNLVQQIRSRSPNEKIFLIGHSHGGSGIAYFLKEHPEAMNLLGGCAFLSTCFVAIRPRSHGSRIMILVLLFHSSPRWLFGTHTT